ncbi:AAA family ATPase [Fibrella aquatica]|uniref:AAA family ATPase n=1 Tax=Fibrella aquatica TaxID=3242487 RepID=UPI00352283C6
MLKRVSIQNFKSLKDVTLDLQKVNLLIGPNNSGKSNFLKALEFFTNTGLNSYTIDALTEISHKHLQIDISAEFTLLPDPMGIMATTYNTEQHNLYHFKRSYRITSEPFNVGVAELINDWFTNSLGAKIDGQVEGGHRREFFDYVRTTAFRPDPSKLVHFAELSATEQYLNFNCSNLISFYYYLDSFYKRHNAKEVQELLTQCIPEFKYFTLPPILVGGKSMLGLRFFDKDDIGYSTTEVSEGVIYFLMILCIINQPNPPKLLLLEEPEKGIHPRRIWEVMKFIFQLAEEKDIQIILTTHNEHVVNAFASMPEAVFVFDKDEEGATHVRNLQRDIIDVSHEKSRQKGLEPIDFTENLGDNWLYGLIGGIPADVL